MEAPEKSNTLPVLVVGAGVAGLTAALDLARLGIPSHLIERDGFLGGQVMRLDKLYPSDHCAFCPVWTEGAACSSHPLVTVHPLTSLEELESADGRIAAVLAERTPAVDPDSCVFCGLCRQTCESKGVAGAITLRPPALTWDPSAPPVPVLDPGLCSRCGACETVCPTKAISPSRLDSPAKNVRLEVADVIFATGFTERNPSPVAEYGQPDHPDIFTALDFETWTGEAGPNSGAVKRRSNGATPRSIAFIQCAGARDRRFLPYCSSVCCMHGLKQARWIKRRLPEASVALFYTDLRAVGKGYEGYARAAAEEGVLLVRGRPGIVFSLPQEGSTPVLALRYEDTATAKTLTAEFDMVVLNGGLAACPLPGESRLEPDRAQTCGFCREPADVAQAVVQGARSAALVAARLSAGGKL
ncbi:MAG: 4Fe-4S binding protein [Desulfobacteraceae bacterium]|nr:4Fe-4S binding protein [Desulfobacteraceae bacterium]